MATVPPWDSSDILKVRKWLREGKSREFMAAQFGLNMKNFSDRCRKNNIKLTHPHSAHAGTAGLWIKPHETTRLADDFRPGVRRTTAE